MPSTKPQKKPSTRTSKPNPKASKPEPVTAENCNEHYLEILKKLSRISTLRETRSSKSRLHEHNSLIREALDLIEQFPSESLVNLKNDKGVALIHHIAKSKQPEFLIKLLKNKDVDVELVNNHNETAACIVTNPVLAKLLIKKGANLLHKRSDGNSAIECIFNQALLDRNEIIQSVLDSGTINEDYVIELVKMGASMDTKGEKKGITILQLVGDSRFPRLTQFYQDLFKTHTKDKQEPALVVEQTSLEDKQESALVVEQTPLEDKQEPALVVEQTSLENKQEPALEIEQTSLEDKQESTLVKELVPVLEQTSVTHSDEKTEPPLEEKIILALSDHIAEQIKRLNDSKIEKGKADKIRLYGNLAEQLKTLGRDHDSIINAILITATISHHRRRRTRDKWFGAAEATSFIAYKVMVNTFVQGLNEAEPLVQALLDSKWVCEDKLRVHINQPESDIQVQGYDDYRSAMRSIMVGA